MNRMMLMIGAAVSSIGLFADPVASPATGVLSFNIRNAAGVGAVTADCETLAGTIPAAAWQENTTDTAGSNHAGTITGVKGWNGTEATTYPGVTFAWKECSEGSVNNIYNTSITTYPFLTYTFNRGSGQGRAADVFSLSVENVPFEVYDVIVYVSGGGSVISKCKYPIQVNGTDYYGDTSVAPYGTVSGSSNSWGDPKSTVLAYGDNVLRVTSMTGGTVTLQYKGQIGHTGSGGGNVGIAAFQIVEAPTVVIPSDPTPVDHATWQVFTNGVLSTDGMVWSNGTATVVYTAAEGYYFAGGQTISTNKLDTTVNPAVNMATPAAPELPRPIVLGDVQGGTVTPDRFVCPIGVPVSLTASSPTAGHAPIITVCKTDDPSVTVPVVCTAVGQYAFVMPNYGVTVSATFGYLYREPIYNADGVATSGIKTWRSVMAETVTPIDSQTELSAGWYIVNADKTISSRIVCNGDVHLILADGCTLTATEGITVVEGSATLTIYAQEAGSGALLAQTESQTAYCAGIGGSNTSSTMNGGPVAVNGGMVTAKGGSCAAGIGGGGYQIGSKQKYYGTGKAIMINGGTVTATGGEYGAGIGGSRGKPGSDITINGGTVTATSGYSGAWGIGYGYTTTVYSGLGIFASPYVNVSASTDNTTWSDIAHADESADLSDISNFRRRYVRTTLPRNAVDLVLCEHGSVSSDAACAYAGETVTLTLKADAACELSSLTVYKTGEETNEVALTTVTEGRKFWFTMPCYGVTVRPDFLGPTTPISSAPTEVAHATYLVYTNGVLSADGTVWSNRIATVVYTAEAGHCFYDGTTVSTNRLDTSVEPAVNLTVPGASFRPEELLLTLGDFNFRSMTFSHAEGLDAGNYRQLTVMLSREMTDETVVLPEVAGYVLNEKLSTAYSYVIDIAAPGKTSAEVAAYIRQIVFNGCRDQKVRIVLDAQGVKYQTFYFDENRHYYQYVPFEVHNAFGWTNCYEKARNMWYMGRRGYLATVTSQQEDIFIYKASADLETGKGRVGWMGGTSCKHGEADSDLYYASFDSEQADKTGNGHWYWACGPERGQEFFDWAARRTVCTADIYTRNESENGYYFNWDSLGPEATVAGREPNGWGSSYCERFLTTLGFGYGYTTDPLSTVPGSKLDSNVYGWNDLKEDGNKGGDSKYDVLGYLVEFGDEVAGDSQEGAFVPGYVTAECLIRAPVVTYDAGEGVFEGGENTNAVAILDVAEGYVLPDPLPTLAGHRIAGWYTNLEDKTTAVMEGSPLWTRADHVVYAKWISATSTPVEIEEPGKDPIVVELPNDLLEEKGYDPEDPTLDQQLQEPDENGQPAWVNMVAGLDPDASLETGAMQDDDKEHLAVVAANLDVPPPDTGFGVWYYLDHVMPGDGSRIGDEPESESSSPNGLSVNLSKVDTNEYYKVRIVVYQIDGDYTREVVATNTLGVLNVKQSPKKTIVSVPWGRLGDGDAEVKVADLVKTANLTPGDRLYAYRMADAREFPYDAWELGEDYQWRPATLVNVGADSQAVLAATGDPAEETIPRGCACWLDRQDATKPFYLYGQLETNATVRSTVLANASGKPCWNLVGSPRVTPLDLNAQFPDGCEGDQIIVPTDGAPKNYTYQGGKWGYYVTVPYKDGVRSVFKTDDTTVTPGLGIWYINNGQAEKSIAW